jgi:hypothetical protein
MTQNVEECALPLASEGARQLPAPGLVAYNVVMEASTALGAGNISIARALVYDIQSPKIYQFLGEIWKVMKVLYLYTCKSQRTGISDKYNPLARQAVSSHDWCWGSSVRCMCKVDALESNMVLSETKIPENLLA